MKFEKSAREVAKLDKQIRDIFKDFEVTNLRINNYFVELNYQNVEDLRSGNEIDFTVLQAFHALLKPKSMQVNAWTHSNGCEKCSTEENYGYVVANFKR